MASSASLDELQRKFDEYPRRYLAPLANEYRKAGALDRAIELCRTHLPDYPEHLSGYVVFGQALYEAGELSEATAVFDTALSLDPENLIALRHMGDIARDRGDRAGARDWYERVLEADPRNEEIAVALQELDAAPQAPPARAADTPRDAPRVISTPAYDRADVADEAAVSAAFEDEPFAPGFFAASSDANPASDETAAAASATHAPHEIEPSELALAAALDTPFVVEEPTAATHAPSTLDGDGAFEFLGLAGGDANDVDARRHAEATGPATAGEFETIDDGPFAAANDGFDASVRAGPSGDYLDEPARDAAAWTGADVDPTPAYGQGFDVDELFDGDDAHQPPAAVTPAADIGYESMEFVAPAREDDADEGGPIVGSPFVTETMAELYLQQGFRDEALDVYEQLLAASPRDQNLRSRVEQLRSGAPSTLGSLSRTDEVPAVTAERSSAEESAASRPADVGSVPEGESDAAVAEHAGETARSFFLRLARAQAAAAPGLAATDDADFDGEAAFLSDDPSPAASEFDFVEPDVAAHHAVAAQTSGAHDDVAFAPAPDGDSLASLFGAEPGSREDEDAASTLATLFGGGTLHHAGGTDVAEPPPARSVTPAFEQPSVRSATPAAAPRATPGPSFSFDQFFSDSPAAPPSAPTPPRGAAAQESARPAPTPEPATPADDAGDLAQFNAWLEGLKKR